MIEIIPTVNLDLIRLSLGVPVVWRWAAEDGVSVHDWNPLPSDAWRAFEVWDNGHFFGIALAEARSSAEVAIHCGLIPTAWGETAMEAGRTLIDSIWRHTNFQRITGAIPATNRTAIAYAKRLGFTEYGLNPQAWRRGGELVDVVLLGLTRPKED